MGLAYAISSAREMSGLARRWRRAAARVVLYEGNGFNGRTFDVNGTVVNLDGTGFNDRAQSMVVYEGTWQLCDDANFGGYCQSFGPGRYSNLGPLSGQLSSLRPVGWRSRRRRRRLGRRRLARDPLRGPESLRPQLRDQRPGRGQPRRHRLQRPRVVAARRRRLLDLLQRRQFQRRVPDLRPRRLSVAAGGLNNRISSGRRVSGAYPYNATPNWSNPPYDPSARQQ